MRVRVSQQTLPFEPGYLTMWTLLANPNPSLLSHDHTHFMRHLHIGSRIHCAVGLSIQVDPYNQLKVTGFILHVQHSCNKDSVTGSKPVPCRTWEGGATSPPPSKEDENETTLHVCSVHSPRHTLVCCESNLSYLSCNCRYVLWDTAVLVVFATRGSEDQK